MPVAERGETCYDASDSTRAAVRKAECVVVGALVIFFGLIWM